MVEDFVLPVLTCLRCGHKWTPRKTPVKRYAKCKSPLWNKPKKPKKEKPNKT